MTAKKIWGPIIWTYFHTIAEKIKPEYESEIPLLYNTIKNICSYLPCPDCSRHATMFLSKVKKDRIRTKNDLIRLLWTFHNNVNQRLKKPEITLDECLNKYKKAITIQVIKKFLLLFSISSRNSKMMMDDFHRKKLFNEINNYFKNNIHKFNL